TAAGLIAAKRVNEAALFFAPVNSDHGQAKVSDWAAWDWRNPSVAGVGRDLCLRGTLKGAN
ncbi:MAG: hypothetical protein EBZ44_04760, partial [Verrucomicrobia bacterium]|nr:hypothetical protein [Verrucomicrobiota bacterium]